MTKVREYVEGYINFIYVNNHWQAHLSNIPYTNSDTKQYKVRIPVPEELLIDELPDQNLIKVD